MIVIRGLGALPISTSTSGGTTRTNYSGDAGGSSGGSTDADWSGSTGPRYGSGSGSGYTKPTYTFPAMPLPTTTKPPAAPLPPPLPPPTTTPPAAPAPVNAEGIPGAGTHIEPAPAAVQVAPVAPPTMKKWKLWAAIGGAAAVAIGAGILASKE